ncbi:Surface composition regulator [Klebsiella variicola]|nr:glycogen synthesis protein GlgS [Klebsiella variicola]VCW85209.1 Surface composition regulator [Klebsiella variicola]
MQAIHHVEKFHPKDFDFIALSLAQMNSQGRKVDVEQVTGSMNDACKSRFLDSYRYHLNLFVEKSPLTQQAG